MNATDRKCECCGVSETIEMLAYRGQQFNAEVDALELRYMRGWIGLGDFRVAMVELYDRADREDHTALHPTDLDTFSPSA